ncbi:MAG TPA: tetratricopeptide repeat protein, partial [Magnetospirillum sp.]|nr:tetratricopeptide repeat protein [Magnetospirillum sp.]
MRTAFAAALLATVIAGPALAQTSRPKPHPKPPAAHTAPQAPAKPSLLQQAMQGDPEAQYQLALAFRDGKGMKKSPAEAVSWFAIAAGNGEKTAAVEVAKAYEQGAGVKRDTNAAALWWQRAGVLGDEAAKARFLQLFLSGETENLGGPIGASWLEALAAQGRIDAILALGAAYEKGEGVPVDLAKARHWYEDAAFSGDTEAQFRLGRMLLSE